MRSILIVIPTYNEVENVRPLTTAIQQVFRGQRTFQPDILFIDDNSPDGTAKVIRSLQRQDNHIKLISGQKAGLGTAYIRGFLHARTLPTAYEAIVMMDADMSHDPAAIPALLRAIDEGADYVIGSRYISGGIANQDWPKSRALSSHLANLAAHVLLDMGNDVRDMTGGFKAIRADALAQIDVSKLRAKGYVFQVALLQAFLQNGFKVTEVPIQFRNRQAGKSKLRLRDVIEFGYLTYRLNPDSRLRRLLRFGLVGAAGTLVNLGVIVILVEDIKLAALSADILAIEISIIFNFFMNHYYTFRRGRTSAEPLLKLLGKLLRFNLAMLGGAAISFGAFFVLHQLLGLYYVLADLLAIALAMAWNYYLSVQFVWRVVDE
jgi:dolichol-phosphate mannosyltransferase